MSSLSLIHICTLILYEAAAKALKEQGFQKLPNLYALKAEYKQLTEQKDQLQRQYTCLLYTSEPGLVNKDNHVGVFVPITIITAHDYFFNYTFKNMSVKGVQNLVLFKCLSEHGDTLAHGSFGFGCILQAVSYTHLIKQKTDRGEEA